MTNRIHGPMSHSYISQRLRLHYVDWGNEDAPPMLLIHGGRDHCRNWDWVAQAFRDDYHIIAPDLRGHGDSVWLKGSAYWQTDFVYDIAQLLRQTNLTPITILSHSLGGSVALMYAGLYPENVVKLVAIEGMGPPPQMLAERMSKPIDERLREHFDVLRGLSGRMPRRYKSVEEAYERMQTENPHLTPEQARHLTVHGVNQNEDGTYTWKFDNYVRAFPPYGLTQDEIHEIWGRISCPTLLFRGTESWASDPVADGRIGYFRDARLVNVDKAGHWVHHDRLDVFVDTVRDFLAE